jgi:hypothetical protein
MPLLSFESELFHTIFDFLNGMFEILSTIFLKAGAATVPPKYPFLGESITTRHTNSGSSAGQKPTKEDV